MFDALKERLSGREDVKTVVAVGEAPTVALNRVQAASQELGYPLERTDSMIRLGGPPISDYLVVEATEMDGGTRVEVRGHAPPEVVHRVLHELAKSRPWTWAPSWD